MKHRTVNNGVRQVRRVTTNAINSNVCAQHIAVVIEAYFKGVFERVALASYLHVQHTRQPHFHRSALTHGKHRGQTRPLCGLRFFTAKASSHTSHIHCHFMQFNAEHFSDQLLNFTGVLTGGVNHDPIIFLR